MCRAPCHEMVMRWNIQAIKFAIGIQHQNLIGLTKKHQQWVRAVQMNTHQLNQVILYLQPLNISYHSFCIFSFTPWHWDTPWFKVYFTRNVMNWWILSLICSDAFLDLLCYAVVPVSISSTMRSCSFTCPFSYSCMCSFSYSQIIFIWTQIRIGFIEI